MALTVYSRILKFYENTDFRLHPKHKAYIGGVVAKKYRSLFDNFHELPITMSEEENGTWMAFVYPDTFTEEIDKIISWYVGILLTPKQEKITEKPAPEPTKRKRIRKAVPVFSGKPINKDIAPS